MKNLLKFFLLGILSLAFIACDDDDESAPSTATFNLSVSGLENLGSDFAYEGWIMVNGSPVSTGVFSVSDAGTPSASSFEVSSEDLAAATAFIISIEPVPDSDPAPSAVKLLAGDFSGNSAALSVNHAAAVGTDFASAAGTYILATPTDDDDTNEYSGVWWLDNSSGSPAVGLTLPTLPGGWKYEGWAVINGTPLSTGTFTSAEGADEAAPFSQGGPPFPGEDFLMNAPEGFTFPVDLRGSAVVISVEPNPDNSPAPFALKPLFHGVPAGADVHTPISMDNNASMTNPTGTVTKN